MLVEKCDKPLPMVRHEKVAHLMKHDVVKAVCRFFGELQVQSDCLPLCVTAAPHCLHFLDEKALDLNAKFFFPLLDQGACRIPKGLAIEVLQDCCAAI